MSTGAYGQDYEDQLIGDGLLAIDEMYRHDEGATGGAAGPWRGWSWAWQEQLARGPRWASHGGTQQLDAFWEAPNWGLLQLGVNRAPSEAAGQGIRVRVSQRDMPLAAGWRASHEAGDIWLPTVSLAATHGRLGLVSGAATGVSASWWHAARKERMHIAVAQVPDATQPGAQGLAWRAPVWLLAHEREGDTWSTATMMFGAAAASMEDRPRGLYQALRRQTDRVTWQLQAIASDDARTSRPSGSGQHAERSGSGYALWGDFVTAGSDTDTFWWAGGIRRVIGHASWLGSEMPGGSGFYLRTRRQWHKATVSGEWDVSRGAGSRDTEWQWIRASVDAASTRWVADVVRRVADQTQFDGELAAEPHARDPQSPRWRHYLRVRRDAANLPWSPSVGTEWSRDNARRRWHARAEIPIRGPDSRATFQVEGGVAGELKPNLTGGASVQWQRDDAQATESVAWFSSVDWRVSPGWTLTGSWSRVGALPLRRQPRAADQGAADPASPSSGAAGAASRFTVGVRYQWSGGTPSAPGAPGSGTVFGTVFLDANENGRFDPSELPAVGVALLISGRYGARTDGFGRFSVAVPAMDDHRLRVLSDGLPLPWSSPVEEFAFSLSPREDRRTDIALVPR